MKEKIHCKIHSYSCKSSQIFISEKDDVINLVDKDKYVQIWYTYLYFIRYRAEM